VLPKEEGLIFQSRVSQQLKLTVVSRPSQSRPKSSDCLLAPQLFHLAGSAQAINQIQKPSLKNAQPRSKAQRDSKISTQLKCSTAVAVKEVLFQNMSTNSAVECHACSSSDLCTELLKLRHV
jgi:hypothetical protein